jgi:hypothetical protein
MSILSNFEHLSGEIREDFGIIAPYGMTRGKAKDFDGERPRRGIQGTNPFSISPIHEFYERVKWRAQRVALPAASRGVFASNTAGA